MLRIEFDFARHAANYAQDTLRPACHQIVNHDVLNSGTLVRSKTQEGLCQAPSWVLQCRCEKHFIQGGKNTAAQKQIPQLKFQCVLVSWRGRYGTAWPAALALVERTRVRGLWCECVRHVGAGDTQTANKPQSRGGEAMVLFERPQLIKSRIQGFEKDEVVTPPNVFDLPFDE